MAGPGGLEVRGDFPHSTFCRVAPPGQPVYLIEWNDEMNVSEFRHTLHLQRKQISADASICQSIHTYIH